MTTNLSLHRRILPNTDKASVTPEEKPDSDLDYSPFMITKRRAAVNERPGKAKRERGVFAPAQKKTPPLDKSGERCYHNDKGTPPEAGGLTQDVRLS